MYDKFSMVADDFINDDEIKATLKYADENKHNATVSMNIALPMRLDFVLNIT